MRPSFARRVIPPLIALLALAAAPGMPAAAPADSVAAPASDYAAFFDAFFAQRADSTRVAEVSNLTFARDAGRFTLEEGRLYLATPVGGRVCAAVFVGRGVFALEPPTPAERERVRQFYGGPGVERAFTALVLVAADSTIAELRRNLVFKLGDRAKKEGEDSGFGKSKKSPEVIALRECLRHVCDPKTREIEPPVGKPFLEGRANGYFFSMIESDAGRLFYEIDPQRSEEVTLSREPKDRHFGLLRIWRRDDVTMFPAASAPDTLPESDLRPVLAVESHRIESRIAGDMGFSAVAELTCAPRDAAPQHWAALTLYRRLDVDAVTLDGRPVPFFRGEESDRLWVRCEPPLVPGETRRLQVSYHGRLIERVGDWMLLGSTTGWYPAPDGVHSTPFDLTFHHPSQYTLVSVGERVSSATAGPVTTSRWRSERPIHNASFVVGLFDEEPLARPGGPEVTALMFRGKPEPIGVFQGGVRVLSGDRMDPRVAADAARAVAFFTRTLGPPPVPRIVIAELPDTGGEAFPGLIQISWTPPMFWSRAKAAAGDAVFRAHEVAHQWWGYGVRYRTYHDQWLSEGFADFSGLWYLQEELGNRKSALDVLEAWRERIFEDVHFRPAHAPPAGSISLGYRSATAEKPEDHALIVYKKGAWVLHMLRNMMLDLTTGDDERFAGLMRDFYARYEGHKATTEDFRRVAQRYAGEDLGWFFDQWVHGTALPTYRFASRTERTADGKYKVTCRVEQSGVPETFRMPVPIRIDFADGTAARVRMTIQGATSTFDLPLMDRAPKAIVLNDLESVLCRVEKVKW